MVVVVELLLGTILSQASCLAHSVLSGFHACLQP